MAVAGAVAITLIKRILYPTKLRLFRKPNHTSLPRLLSKYIYIIFNCEKVSFPKKKKRKGGKHVCHKRSE